VRTIKVYAFEFLFPKIILISPKIANGKNKDNEERKALI